MTYGSEQKFSQNVLSVHSETGMLRAINIQLEALPDVLTFDEANSLIELLKPTVQAFLDMKCLALDEADRASEKEG